MIVSVCVMTDDGEHFAMRREMFDERTGYHWRQLHKLYRRCRTELAIKVKKAAELEAKDGGH